MAVEPNDPKSLPDLLLHALRETGELIQTEIRLVRSELSDKITQIEVGGGSLVAGAILLLVALLTLTAALVNAVAQIGTPDIGAGWAALIVGVVIAIVGVLLMMKGKRDLDAGNLMPERTARQLQKDGKLVKEQVR